MSAFLYENGELITVSKSNPLPVSTPDGLTVSGTATSAAVLFTTSMLNYESITVQVMSAGTGCTISYETSDDNVVWVACSGLTASNTGYSLLSATSSTTGMSQFARKGLYLERVLAHTVRERLQSLVRFQKFQCSNRHLLV